MWKLIRKPLFLFPAEPAHVAGMTALRALSSIVSSDSKTFPFDYNGKPNLLNVLNPIGLAAGLDKNCEILEVLPFLGFGFAEIGTITPRPQGGNEKPRMFRDEKTQSLFNRMGFNNLGAGIISARLKRAKPKLPPGFRVGVNLGKNKTTAEADAAQDYAIVANAFLDTADYFVINVSSPNTPGLRSLQTVHSLIPIVQAVQQVASQAIDRKIPIFVKLAPELATAQDSENFSLLIQALEAQRIDGLVLTNTLQGDYIYRGRAMSGGWSGRCLTEKSREALINVKKITSLPIISVGGIDSTAEALKRLELGASLVQVYSAWVYEGPFWIRNMIKEMKSGVRLLSSD